MKEHNINLNFLNKLVFIIIFITITPVALFTSMFALSTVSNNNNGDRSSKNVYMDTRRGVQIYASLPDESPSVSSVLGLADARVVIIENFLKENNSPMTPYADFIVKTSDKYGLDYRLIPAIAMKESGLGRLMPHDNCNNAWGYGIHSAGTLCFDSWEEGIEEVSRGLKVNYQDIGLVTPEEIMSKWIPHSPGGLWAVHVEDYMNRLN
ncbi:glucosaminidase domain-containing protein [Candidatus Woesebacteria bacterium]|nr:glucosaminidase domain-containing protein [Candidatus Woesebacteria bacterium]